LAASFALGPLLGLLLGSRFWHLAAPRLRNWIGAGGSFTVSMLATIGLTALPRGMGFGWGWFSGVSPRYPDCGALGFGARGLFDGLIGGGVPAISQLLTLAALLLTASLLGGLLA